MIVKIHKAPEDRKVVAICDEQILGKEFEEDGLVLDLTSSFYQGEKTSKKNVLNILKDANIVNAAGKKSIELLKDLGLVTGEKIVSIEGIPHVQIFFY